MFPTKEGSPCQRLTPHHFFQIRAADIHELPRLNSSKNRNSLIVSQADREENTVMKPLIDNNLIAPCGMNCAVCSAYLSFKNNLNLHKCIGCRPRNKQCAFLKKKCKDNLKLLKGNISFCYECSFYPCDRLKRLDERYRTQYQMSMIENLNLIKEKGLEELIKKEIRKYRCPKCGELKSTHNNRCFRCQRIRHLKK